MQLLLLKQLNYMLKQSNEDSFNPEKSLKMKEELMAIKDKLIKIPVYFKSEIVISYFKNHSIKNEWIMANPELVSLLLSGSCTSGNIESLFDFCRLRPEYVRNFESYIRTTLLS